MLLARRIALWVWVFASISAAAYIAAVEFDERLAEAIYWTAPLGTLFVACASIQDRQRRWFYRGVAMAGAAGAFSIYGVAVLEDRAVIADGHRVWQDAFEDYMNREFAGWEYDDETWMRSFDSVLSDETGVHRVALATLAVRHESRQYLVFGGCNEHSWEGGFQDPSFFVYPLDHDGQIVPAEKFTVRWPRTVALGPNAGLQGQS